MISSTYAILLFFRTGKNKVKQNLDIFFHEINKY